MQKLVIIFITVFLAELGDKTQLATLFYATDQNVGKTGIFFASAGALVLSTAVAVIFGGKISSIVSPIVLKAISGSGFVLIGFWMLFQTIR
ncbi:MAG: TMEM165/GDT1 family protein (plasmid) [Candidatus Manganitrophus sp.]|nr:TMEM165/GDT1 family protein [Candidatus Manganitrophus morganii]MDC4206925.1 TMEM165/GDT1 family protein [Candidatus Manganitrophus sp.]MDC4228186.1 TMEM165/GDT1 family protein [Candidatus Manganitrophus sp.]WDT73565.1 MAG: TMEM165/GDT1 family protein [Candidatus Manganitrophus sp.]WDT77736.1 MAG: TMEM165/GDT1 family protein [Candidatus Manganitrophus sp.]